jgi:predicted transcriptional regulator
MEIADVLHAISDIKSLDMFCFIAKESVDVEVLKQKKGLSKKQFYSRASQLLKVGLIKRKKGRFSLTAFGAVVYHAQLVIESGIKNYWKLKAVDSIRSSTDIGEQERVKLIKSILGDNRIEKILMEWHLLSNS